MTETERPNAPISVLLPTVRWTDACEEVATQLGDGDELLVICDAADDPVADRRGTGGSEVPTDAAGDVRVLVAGEPEGCSGKANAIAAGMEAAANDRIVWTDDDFRHPPEWLATLSADYERQGPTTEIPVFIGADPLGRFLEPGYAIGGTLGLSLGSDAWGGGVVFERGDLDADALLADLRRTVSDDGTLSEHLDVRAADRTRTVVAGGSLRESLERFVRFQQITRTHAPLATAFNAVLSVGLATLCLLAPVAGVTLVTALVGAVYARFGIRRPTFLLAGPGVIASPVLMAYALSRRTFVWGGRRYRWRSMFEVDVVEP